MKALRCPKCGKLLGKSAESNTFPIHLRCRNDKIVVQFTGGTVQVLPQSLDTVRAAG